MWSVFFLLLLSYLDRDLAQSVDVEKESEVFLHAPGGALSAKTSTTGSHSLHEVSDAKVVPAHAQIREESQVPGDDGAQVAHKLRRSKRGFTYPGTLWCGAGNIADDYDQLGEFTETDRCCRTHDHCAHVIHAFSTNYGYTNFKWHSISHCDCDNALKRCLRVVNDTSSRVVGQAFFNVIEVPCFEFAFEEQCVERHWYGVCKRYDRVPVAVIKDSIPYDFGGIEVIDVLTLAPPKKKPTESNDNKKEKEQDSESTTQSSFTGSKSGSPEEPSLTNVVTAAEDFIKVLATVSTSQSSSADSGKGEAQTSDKKRKKNAGKKKKDSKKRRGKGKGKKRKQNANRVSKAEEVVVGSPSANRSEEVINKNHFVEEPPSNKNNDNFMADEFGSVADRGHSNKMMRDGYLRMPEESQHSTSVISNEKEKEEEMLEIQKQIKVTEPAQVSSTVNTPLTVPSKPRRSRLRQRAERKSHGHLTLTSNPLETALHNRIGDNTPMSATESTSQAGQTTQSPISPAGEEAPRSFEYRGEKGSAFIATTQNTPIVATKRPRSRQKGGRKRSRKLSTPSSPIVSEVPHASIAEEASLLTTDTTQVMTVNLSPEPSQSLSERLQQNSHQRVHGSRARYGQPSSTLSTMEDTSYKNKLISLASTNIYPGLTDTDFQSLPETKNAAASTGQLVSLLQTNIPSVSSLKAKKSKRRRSKERDDKKRIKNKDTDTEVNTSDGGKQVSGIVL